MYNLCFNSKKNRKNVEKKGILAKKDEGQHFQK